MKIRKIIFKYIPATIVFLGFLGFCVYYAMAADWIYESGGRDEIWGIAVDSTGDVIVVGNSNQYNSDAHQFILKYDYNGNIEWVHRDIYIDNGNNERFYDVAITANNEIVAVGEAEVREEAGPNTSWNRDVLTIKYDSDGNELWRRLYDSDNYATYTSEYGYAVAIDSFGNIYAGGMANNDFLIVKYDPDGNELWAKNYDYGSTYEKVRGLVIDANNNIVFSGQETSGDDVIWIVKCDSNGENCINDNFANGATNYAYGRLAMDNNGDFYVFGYSRYDDMCYVLLKYSNDLVFQWNEFYCVPGEDLFGYGVDVDSSGNIVGVGFSSTNKDIYKVRYDTNGNFLSDEIYDYADLAIAHDVFIDSNDYAIIGGTIINNDYDSLVINPGAGEPPLPDTTPPVRSGGVPSGTMLPFNTSETTISLNTDENATCKYATTTGIAYSAMTDGFSTTGGMSHSENIIGLSDGEYYQYYIRCEDSFGNANVDDYDEINFRVSPGGVGALGEYMKIDEPTEVLDFYNENINFPYNFANTLNPRILQSDGAFVTWKGEIYIPIDGDYNFAVDVWSSAEATSLFIDGVEIWSASDDISSNVNNLTSGWKVLYLDYQVPYGTSDSQVQLYWTVPVFSQEIVPEEFLRPPVSPATPTDLVAQSSVCEVVDLTWADNSSDEQYFELERKSNGNDFLILQGKGGLLTENIEFYQDTAITGDLEYTYRIKACNIDDICSNWSNETSVIPESCGPTPSFFLSNSNDISVKIGGGEGAVSNSTTITVTPLDGFVENITLTLFEVRDPDGLDVTSSFVNYTFSDVVLDQSEYVVGSDFSITVPGDSERGNYTIKIRGAASSISDVEIILNVEIKYPFWKEIFPWW